MTTRDKVLQIRAEEPNRTAAQIAQSIGVTSGRVYQILKEQGLGAVKTGERIYPGIDAALEAEV